MRSRRPTVMVTDAGLGSAISVIRSLGRRGWRVIAADEDRWSPGFRSRYTDERVVYPAPRERDSVSVARGLARICAERGVDLLIPVTDQLVMPFARLRDAGELRVPVALPGTAALELARDKGRTLELARELNVPVPATCVARDANEALAAARTIGWPVVVKPTASRHPRADGTIEQLTVSYAADVAQLEAAVGASPVPVLLQRYHRGVGYGVELLLDRGRPIAAFQHRRLREMPVTGGASALRESVAIDPTMYRHATSLMAALEWTGLAMIEFKVGDDGPLLMEINGRIWGSMPLAIHAGMDFPRRLAELWAGDGGPDQEPSTSYRIGVRSRNLELDIMWIGAVALARRHYAALEWPRRSRAVRAALQLFDPGIHNDVVSMSDPGPGAAELVRIARKAFAKVRD
jgi:predicted ATP-grasp superfamily ATP-dependent carboligase